MSYRHHVAAALADALLAGPASEADFAERAMEAIGRHRWIRGFAERACNRFGSHCTYGHRRELIRFILEDEGYDKWACHPHNLKVLRYFLPPAVAERRIKSEIDSALPILPAPAYLAAWLGITLPELEWYADARGMIRNGEGKLCHYRYKWIAKRSGDYRLIESPKDRLRTIQRKILHEILDRVPAHRAAHGFRRNHSCLTYAAPHIGRSVVLRMDLSNFFGSISVSRVHALFASLGYPQATARLLAGLCTNRTPVGVFRNIAGAEPGYKLPWQHRKDLRKAHLPQGAPTSPALANLCALFLDFRLAALAGSKGGYYTRYADDLAFSGGDEMRRDAGRLSTLIAAIAMEEGFGVNFRKTRIMHESDRQILTGIVINEKTNMQRREYDRLKAILHNCLRLGPSSQNRERHPDLYAHLSGRLNHLKRLNPARGRKLQALFGHIEWSRA